MDQSTDQNRWNVKFELYVQVTGVASSPEFKDYLDNAPDYRSRAPG